VPIYQIFGWDTNFENSRSREIEHPAFVIMPNKQHGMGFQRILGQADGVAMFGLWVLILQACSRQRQNAQQQRQGWLTDDGTATGVPWDAEDLALRWKQPVEFCQRALELFSHPKVGWLKRHQDRASADLLPTDCRSPADADGVLPQDAADRTEQNGTEQKETTSSPPSSPARTAPTATRRPSKVVAIDTAAARRAIDDEDLMGLVKAYGGNLELASEWAFEADGLTVHTVGAILDWQYRAKARIRQPSGLRVARTKWRDDLTAEYRAQLGAEFFRSIGLDAQVLQRRPAVPA